MHAYSCIAYTHTCRQMPIINFFDITVHDQWEILVTRCMVKWKREKYRPSTCMCMWTRTRTRMRTQRYSFAGEKNSVTPISRKPVAFFFLSRTLSGINYNFTAHSAQCTVHTRQLWKSWLIRVWKINSDWLLKYSKYSLGGRPYPVIRHLVGILNAWKRYTSTRFRSIRLCPYYVYCVCV